MPEAGMKSLVICMLQTEPHIPIWVYALQVHCGRLTSPGSGCRNPGLWRVFQQSAKFLPQLRRVLVTVDAHSVLYGCVEHFLFGTGNRQRAVHLIRELSAINVFSRHGCLQLIGCGTKHSPWR